MSKIAMNRRGKIVDRALELFNERGIEYVGLRELAADLKMRVSNITYYFPTKDDLVFEIASELTSSNAEIIVANEQISMTQFLEMLEQVYINQHRFRGLFKSVVHVLSQNKRMTEAYQKTQHVRTATIGSNIQALAKSGYLQIDAEEELNFLVSTLSLISRFWISEAAISARNLDKDGQIKYYLKIVTNLITPYASAKAKKEITQFRKKL